MTEGDIMRSVMLALSNEGHFVVRVNVGKFKMQDGRWFDTGLPAGFADLCGHRAGDARAFYLEIKTPTGRVRPEQAAFLDAMRRRGAIAGVARSVADAINLLRNSHQSA
jgi:hypothetical protein